MSDEPTRAPERVREWSSMIALMQPVLKQGRYIFCTLTDPELAPDYQKSAIGMFMEGEGLSFILPEAAAQKLGVDCALPMRMITLAAYSTLDGVGLTAAVAGELAALNIACNVVAAYHHDHLFVPEADAVGALDALARLQRRWEAD